MTGTSKLLPSDGRVRATEGVQSGMRVSTMRVGVASGTKSPVGRRGTGARVRADQSMIRSPPDCEKIEMLPLGSSETIAWLAITARMPGGELRFEVVG